jgi:predicted transposase YbfD/YdcC
MGCQRDIAKAIVGKGTDYLLAVKGNQKHLEKAFNDDFRMEMLQNFEGSSYSTQEEGHGRKETRVALVNEDLSLLGDIAYDWPELKVMGIVASIRQVGDIPAEDISIRYYISSKKLDACRIRRDEAGENFAAIRHIALNADKSFKAGLKRKRTRAGRNNSYLSGVLMGQGAS